jgi:hypothetical protein
LRRAIPAGLTVTVITDLPVNTSVAPVPGKSDRFWPASRPLAIRRTAPDER